MVELVDICLSCGLWFCLDCIGQVSRIFKSWLLMDSFFSLFTSLFHNYMELCSLWAWWMLLPSWDSPACSSGMAFHCGWECLSNALGLQNKQNIEICVSREPFCLSRHAGYEWENEKKHGLEGAWVELQVGPYREMAPSADLSRLSISSMILSWWDLLPGTKGGLVFSCIRHHLSQVSQVLHFSSCQHLMFLLPTTVSERNMEPHFITEELEALNTERKAVYFMILHTVY